jgi:hypothetical protein
MKSLRARISIADSPDRRQSPRWRVELLVSFGAAYRLSGARVRNLSEIGMLLETDVDLRVGEIIVVDLPGASETEAQVVWQQDCSFGCAFLTPLPTAVISAALLQAPLSDPFGRSQLPEYEEFPIAISPSVDELASWKSSFERTRGAEGYRIIAYRQTSGGLMIAIASRTA